MVKRIILAIIPLLSACATAHGTPHHLGKGEWRFTLIDGNKPVSGKTRLSIQPERINAYVGCNGMGGGFRIEQNKLVIGPVISTQMWCDGVMEQERAVQQLFAATPEYRLSSGKLTLSGGAHTAELEPVK